MFVKVLYPCVAECVESLSLTADLPGTEIAIQCQQDAGHESENKLG